MQTQREVKEYKKQKEDLKNQMLIVCLMMHLSQNRLICLFLGILTIQMLEYNAKKR